MSQALRVMVGGRVVFNTRAIFLSFAIWNRGDCARALLKDLPPTQLCKEVSLTVDMVRLEAALQLSSIQKKKKLSHRPGGWAGLFTAKGCGAKSTCRD